MKILVVKSIFCPNDFFLDISMQSILHLNVLLSLFKSYPDPIEFDLLVIGWVNKYEEILNAFFKFHTFIFTHITKHLWKINYGKYKIINEVISYNKQHNTDLIIYLDHDVMFDLVNIKIFRKSLDLVVSNPKINDKYIGLVAFNHKGDCRHQPSIYENSTDIDNIRFVYPTRNGAIACGAYMISSYNLKKLTQLEVRGVYGMDDYYLTQELESNGFINVVIRNYFIVHPFCYIDKYCEWKTENIKRIIHQKNINYYQNIEESSNLWNS